MEQLKKLIELQSNISEYEKSYTSTSCNCGCGGGATNCNGNF